MVHMRWKHALLAALSVDTVFGASYYDQKFSVKRSHQSEDELLSQTNSTFSLYNVKAAGIENICQIPVLNSDYTASQTPILNATELKKQKEEAVHIIKEFNYLNRGAMSEKGGTYWTYSVRFDHDVLQYHRGAPDSGNGLIVFKLASWSNEDDYESLNNIPYHNQSFYTDPYEHMSNFELIQTEEGVKYVSQRVGNGEICDLTGLPRTTTINYKCNLERETPFVANVDEWRTCEYVIDLESSFFCNREMWSEPRTLKNNEIYCFTKDQVSGSSKFINLQGRKIEPLASGFMLTKDLETKSKFSLLLTKNYELWEKNQNSEEAFQRLLGDVSLAFQGYIRNLNLFPIISTTPFKMLMEVFDIDRQYIGNLMIEQDSNGFLVSYFTDDPVPESSNIIEETLEETLEITLETMEIIGDAVDDSSEVKEI